MNAGAGAGERHSRLCGTQTFFLCTLCGEIICTISNQEKAVAGGNIAPRRSFSGLNFLKRNLAGACLFKRDGLKFLFAAGGFFRLH
jgi:hypothetical protein